MDDLYARTLRAGLWGLLALALVVFLPAGTLDYWQGWAYFGTLTITSTVITVYMAVHDTRLLESRLRAGPSAEPTTTQKIIMTFALAAFVVSVVVPVLDHRFRWSPAVPAYLSVVGDALIVLSYLLIFFVLKENTFGASTVVVREDQRVISSGPYAIVRHPMYAGVLPMLVGTPLALDSWWGLLAVPPFVGVLVWRLLDEERFLRENLPGYVEYTQTVRHRLIPAVW